MRYSTPLTAPCFAATRLSTLRPCVTMYGPSWIASVPARVLGARRRSRGSTFGAPRASTFSSRRRGVGKAISGFGAIHQQAVKVLAEAAYNRFATWCSLLADRSTTSEVPGAGERQGLGSEVPDLEDRSPGTTVTNSPGKASLGSRQGWTANGTYGHHSQMVARTNNHGVAVWGARKNRLIEHG